MRKHVRTRTKSSEELTEDREYYLFEGFWFFGQPFSNADDERETWIEYRDMLLSKWVDHAAGSRPSAWWKFDAPEPRQRVDGGKHALEHPGRIAEVNRIKATYPHVDHARLTALSFGLPAILFPEFDFQAEYESEDEYLDRHGLWLPEEKNRFEALLTNQEK